jgi:hypothetical protein
MEQVFLQILRFPLSVSFHKCPVQVHTSITNIVQHRKLTSLLINTRILKHKLLKRSQDTADVASVGL